MMEKKPRVMMQKPRTPEIDTTLEGRKKAKSKEDLDISERKGEFEIQPHGENLTVIQRGKTPASE